MSATMNAPTKENAAFDEAVKAESGKGYEWAKQEGAHLTIHFTPRGIRLTPTPEGIEHAKDLVSEGHAADTSRMLEDFIGNGWDFIPPDHIGALTGCTDIISQTFTLTDAGSWVPNGEPACVYWHESYAVEMPIEEWAAGRDVQFDRAEVE